MKLFKLLLFMPVFLYSQPQIIIPVGSYPYALVYNSTNTKIYCANFGDNTVSVINTQNNQVIETIRVGACPYALVYNSTANKVYCANQQSNDVSIINDATNEVINTVEVGLRPSALLFHSASNKVYCANSSSNSISVIDGVNDNVIATINVGGYPTCFTYNSTNNKIYCANTDNESVSIIDGVTNDVIATIQVGRFPNSLAYNPVNNEIYCSSWANGRIHMISGLTNQLVDSIIYGNSGPQSLIHTYGNRVCYVNFTGDNIKMIDGASDTIIITYQFPAGTRPYAILYFYGFVYCANIGSNNIYRLYESSLLPYFSPHNTNYPVTFLAMYIPNWGDRLYVTNLWSSTVSAILFYAIEEQSVSSVEPASVTIYPNPAKTFFTICFSQSADCSDIRLYDVTGKIVKIEQVKGPNVQTVSLKGINSGIYFVQVNGETIKTKLIVTK